MVVVSRTAFACSSSADKYGVDGAQFAAMEMSTCSDTQPNERIGCVGEASELRRM